MLVLKTWQATWAVAECVIDISGQKVLILLGKFRIVRNLHYASVHSNALQYGLVKDEGRKTRHVLNYIKSITHALLCVSNGCIYDDMLVELVKSRHSTQEEVCMPLLVTTIVESSVDEGEDVKLCEHSVDD